MLKNNLSTALLRIEEEVQGIDSYEKMLEYAKEIAHKHEFFQEVERQIVSDGTTLNFWKHFERGRTLVATLAPDIWEKKLYNFYFINQEETFRTDESRIAHLLFTHLKRLRE